MQRSTLSRASSLALVFGLSFVNLLGCPPSANDGDDDGAICATRQALGEGRCEGVASRCSSFSALNCVQDGCRVDIGDYDDPYDDECEGYADECSEMRNENQCGYQRGCTWVGADDEGVDGGGNGAQLGGCDDDGGGGGQLPGGGSPGGGGSSMGDPTPGAGGGAPTGGGSSMGGSGPGMGGVEQPGAGGGPGMGGSDQPGMGGSGPAPP